MALAYKDDVKEKILDVAQTIFGKFGFKKTTVDEIAAAARKAKSSIYYYFKSKEEIFEAVIEKEASLIRVDVIKILESNIDSIDKIKQYMLVRMKALTELVNFNDAYKNQYLDHLPFIEKIRVKYDEEEIGLIGRILKEGVDTGKFYMQDVNLTSIAIVTAMKGLEAPLFINTENSEMESRINSLLDILFYGIVVR
ncbi:MAG: TetR/AcrR family transcriptional regulator [Chlorobi bacterium]|nr:TetR/AcrR family transcriptional regulator [Chlorobiota bacterium]